MTNINNLYQILTEWARQKRQQDNTAPAGRGAPTGKAGTPFAKVGIPSTPSSVTVPIPPFNGIGDLLDTPGIAPEEGSVAPGGNSRGVPSSPTPAIVNEEDYYKTYDPRVSTKTGDKYQYKPRPEDYNPFKEDGPPKLTPPAEAMPQTATSDAIKETALQPDAPFVNNIKSDYTPNITPPEQGSSTQSPPERGFFDRVTRNPLFLTGAGVLANSMRSPGEALGIGALGAAQQYQSNKRYDDQLSRQDRRLDIEDKRYTAQDEYNRRRNDLTDKRLDREFDYKQRQDAISQKKLDALQRHQDLTRTVAIQQQVEKEIESQRKSIYESGDKKAIDAFEKSVPIMRRQLTQEKTVQTRLMTPGAGISYEDLATGPGGIFNLR